MPRQFDRRQFLAATAASSLIGADGGDRAPSYLVIVADQLTWWMTDPLQRGKLQLPNIDRLRSEGTVFERCYSTSPVCKPVRVTLRTGFYPHANTGAPNLVHPIETVEERLAERGYATRYVGKWHVSPGSKGQYVEPESRPHWRSFVGHEYSHNQFVTFVMNDRTPVPTGKWDSGTMTDFALRQLRMDAANGQRFFMQLNYLPPHHPYHTYPNWLKTYDVSDVTLRPNVPSLPGDPRIRISAYMDLVSGVDLELGRILDEVDASGMDVVVIFTSDHGDMLWSHGEEYKRKPWEESARVPLIVRGPGWPARTIDYPVGLIDVPRTIAHVGQGMDLRQPRDSVYYEFANGGNGTAWHKDFWRALVTDDGWKLAISAKGPRLLHDLTSDPYELTNLAGQAHPQETALHVRMLEWARQTGDPFFG
jgi:arylsulfatase A-like enzyme